MTDTSSPYKVARVIRPRPFALLGFGVLFLAVAMLAFASPVSAVETVTIFAADCTTPQTIFHLGDTVCAKVDNVAGGDLNNIYLEWVTPSGAVLFGSAATTLVTTSPQTFTQLLPTSGANVEFGRWHARTANSSDTSPRVTANFDVARLSVIGIRRGSTFYFRSANTVGPGDVVFPFGDAGDVGLIGDWNGDGTHTPGLYRPSTQTFFLASTLPFAGIPDLVIPYGALGDIPLVGDWDGNGTWTIGVYRPSDNTFYLRNSNTVGPADLVIPYGDPGDLPVVGDWDGDGTWTIGVYRPSNNTFYLRNSNTVGFNDILVPYGAPGDKPVVGDWNADDLKSTIGIYRPAEATFYLRNSNTIGFADLVLPFGDIGDTPVIARVNVNKAPAVDPATFSLPENSPNGTVVGTATYVDLDFGQSHTFGITAGNTGTAFAINAGTGQITVNNSAALDFETTPQFLLTVQVTDNGVPPRSGTNTITVNLSNVNEAPSITAGGTLNYTENGPATPIDTTVTVTDDSNITGATVQITTNCVAAQDVLSFANTANITGTPGSCSMTLAGSDTVANYNTALRSVKYNNTSDNPSTSARTVSWQVTDGTFTSNTATSTINVAAVNDPPVLTAGATLGYIENDPATPIDTTITITDLDSANLTGATAVITVNCASLEDVLSFTNTVNIIGTPGSCSMTLAGTDTVANYVAALKSVKYRNSSDNPSGLSRTVTWQVNDGAASNNLSNTATSTINVTPVNDPPTGVVDKAHTVTGNVRIQVPTGSGLLVGVSDIEGNALIAQVDASNASTGNITINADGSYLYNPAAGFTGGTDTVKFKVCDNGAPPACSAVHNLTLTVSDMVWFIDNSLGAPGDGRLTSPFNSISGFTGINDGTGNHPKTGQVIFIDRNTATDYTGPLTLQNNQKVLGKGGSVGLASFAGIPLAPDSDALPTTGGTAPNITTSAAATNGITLASGNTIRGLTVGATTGAKIFGNTFGTVTIGNTTTPDVALSGAGKALDLTSGTFAATSKFSSVATTSSATQGLSLASVAGTVAFGSTTVSGSTTQGISVTNSSVNINFGNTSVTTSGGTGVLLGAVTQGNSGSLTFADLDITPNGGHFGLVATENTGTITTTSGTISTTTNSALAIAGVSTASRTPLAMVLDSVSSTGGTNNISVTNASGSLAMNGGALSGSTGASLTVSGSTATVSYAGSITNLSGAGEISLTNNTGGTINLTGGMSLSTGANTAFTATGGGTVNVTQNNTTIVNTLGSTGTALNVANTTIGASGLTFRSISSNGGTNGIVLSSTGSSGGLTVTGNGGSCTSTATCTGGAIQNKTGDGINLNSMTATNSVTLNNMAITSSGGSHIDATSVKGLTLNNMFLDLSTDHGIKGSSLTNLTISGGTFDRGGLNNTACNFDGMNITNLLGTSTISGATFKRSNTRQLNINNTTSLSSPDQLTINNTNWNTHDVNTVPNNVACFGDHIDVAGDTGSNFRLTVNSTGGGNVFKTAGTAVQASGNGSGTVDAPISGVTSGGTFASGNANTTGVNVVATASSNVTFDMASNTTLGTGSTALIVRHFTNGTIVGKMRSNNVTHVAGVSTDAVSLINQGDGSSVHPTSSTTGNGTGTVSVSNNTVSGDFDRGIYTQAAFSNGTFNQTINNNGVTGTDAAALQGIFVEMAGSGVGSGNDICLNEFSNNVSMTGALAAYRLVHRSTTNCTIDACTFKLQDFVGNGTLLADVTNWITTTKSNVRDGDDTISITFNGQTYLTSAGCPTPP